MEWAFIVPIIMLLAGSVTIAVFSLREAYRLSLERCTEAAEQFRQTTKSHIDIYERMHGLVFFFGGDPSTDKTEFSYNESMSMQDLFDLNVRIDLELSLLSEKVSKSESLLKERGASFRKISEDLEQFESEFFISVVKLNKCIRSARLFLAFKPSRRIFEGLGKCAFKQIVFEKR